MFPLVKETDFWNRVSEISANPNILTKQTAAALPSFPYHVSMKLEIVHF